MNHDEQWERTEAIAGDKPGSPQFWIADGSHYVALFNDAADAERACRAVNCHDALVTVLQQIINDLPTNRDWLDPVLEKQARVILALAGEVVTATGRTPTIEPQVQEITARSNEEALALLKEILDWTRYKGTPWAKRAAAIVGQPRLPEPASESPAAPGSQGGNLVQNVTPPPVLSGRDYRAEAATRPPFRWPDFDVPDGET